MTRPMLSVFSAIVLCASTFTVMAADSTAAQASTSQQVRIQTDAKREQITGADKVELPAAKTSSALLDAPVATDDAPDQAQSQEQQP
ncbi:MULTISPECIES: hypothetical protein [unclassified Pseudomonas]|uniref:hypothetical protein n=1 Tax=Pseudomonas sp. R1-18 TaxID=1632772 RepID=UPI003DAA3B98